ncbi:MAG TPA: hypothetical protein VND99_02565 [Candidatus Acidoferrales bacterium]|nr:hypothetical protein [Candidatus Acidoferrales bacterium]
MKKFLPILISFAFLFITLVSPAITFAQLQNQQAQTDSRWVIDPEVTFIGKNARRSGDFLNWTLQNYSWACVKQDPNSKQCDNSGNPIAKYWSSIVLFIVVPMLFIVILATSIVIIVTRGKSLTIMRFIPRFIAVVLLIVFSYSLLQFFYQFTDLIQGFFLRSNIGKVCPPNCISDKDLLYVGWSYKDFVGLRLLGDKYAESAFTSLLLTKLTALTYFVMVFLLLVRKIILWFFIIVSPIFPILLLYYPVRNTGKIWIGEFFRWLLYAPLFAIFLNGLVYLWRNQIPLVFPNAAAIKNTPIEYPTAVNILLGGPQQIVSPANSVNLVGTFALYVVSLIMLWIVILLPWILLQIFLDYAQNFAPGDTAVMKTLVNIATNKGGGGTGPKPSSGGAAVNIPFAKKFSVPIDIKPGPTGAAKEIKAEHATISNATFSKPAFIPNAAINNASVNASVLNAANVKLPSMRDIARFDVALQSNDISKLKDVNKFSEQLVRIANPIVVSNTIERSQVKEIREKIVQQSQRGNHTASSVLNAAHASSRSMSNLSSEKVKNALQQISNPATAPTANREKMSQLNSMLKKESSQNKNQLAASILSVNDKTSDKEVEKIKSQLMQSSNNQVSKAVTSAISQSAKSSDQVQTMIKQIANVNSVTTSSDQEHITKLRGTLEKASKEGNSLAASILSVNEKTSASEIEALQERIQQAKETGEPIATEVTSAAKETNETSLPMVNRMQNVKQEDYQAVKDMWKQNYQNLEVPQGMAGTRADWIKDDITGIDETIALLSSPDQNKVQQGMDQVSNLLPFLLVGGFSQTEIVNYLKAKQSAAKEVSQQLATEEEEKVSIGVKTQHAVAQQTMAATVDEPSSSSIPEEEESSLSASALASAAPAAVATHTVSTSTTQSSNDMLQAANLTLPKLKDIALYETRHLTKDKVESQRVQELHKELEKIANPASFTGDPDHGKIEALKQKLVEESQKGNTSAGRILNAATSTVGDTSQLPSLPDANQAQTVAKQDYEDVKKLWEENYRTLPVPSEYGSDTNGRIAWVTADTKYVEETVGLLSASEAEKIQEGEKRVANIMPILLLGGFSSLEVVEYLKAKQDAGTTVLAELQKEEEGSVSVPGAADKKEQENTQAAEATTEEEKKE